MDNDLGAVSCDDIGDMDSCEDCDVDYAESLGDVDG
jgi:hypothetical protein